MTTETQQAPTSGQAPHVYLNRLEGLAEVLASHGLRTSLMAPPGRVPSLHVVNPAASALRGAAWRGGTVAFPGMTPAALAGPRKPA